MKTKRLTVLLALLFLYALQGMSSTFNVNIFIDTPDANPGDGFCKDASGNCSIRAAVMEANALAGADIIIIPSGSYSLSITGSGENGALTGDLDILSTITIQGANAISTSLDAMGIDRVFHVSASGALEISHLSIKGGLCEAGNGGGVYNQGFCNFSYVNISDNICRLPDGASYGGGFGGGIANEGSFQANGVSVINNTAKGAMGRGALSGGGGGGSTPGMGGGIFNETAANFILDNSTLSGNRALGGFSSGGATNGGSFSSPGSDGAGPAFGAGGAAAAGAGGNGGAYSGGGGGGSSCGVGGTGGTGGYGAGGGGRGASACSGGSGTVGPAGFGGGAGNGSCCSSSGGGGAGAGLGGGAFNNGGTLTITSSTIAFNEALGGYGRTGQGGYAGRGLAAYGFGGGLFNRVGTVEVNNSIVSNNLADTLDGTGVSNGADMQDLWGTITSTSGYNLVMTIDGSTSLSGTTAGNQIGVNPSLLPLMINAGETYTHRPDPCIPSPALNAGLALFPVDQTGQATYLTPDIGAWEEQTVCVLAIEDILDFEGEKQGENNSLSWVSVGEVKVYYLNHSTDGKDWNIIGELSGREFSGIPLSYSFIHENPPRLENFYRLSMMDSDGASSHSNVVLINNEDGLDGNSFSLEAAFPSPFSDDLSFTLKTSQDGNLRVELVNQLGVRVLSESIQMQSGTRVYHLEGLSIASGIYSLVLIDSSGERYQLRKVVRK